MSKRYVHLQRAVEATVGNSLPKKAYRILEIGVFNGEHARLMIDTAFKHGRKLVEYYGFDLFENMTPEKNAAEVGKSTLALSLGKVEKYLRTHTKAVVKLFKGDSVETLPAHAGKIPPIDLLFIDGGHSVKTIAADWNNVQPLIHAKTVVLLDDFYPDDVTTGARHLVEYLKDHPGWDVQVRAPIDGPPAAAKATQIVWLRPKAWPLPEHPAYAAPDGFMTAKVVEVPRVPGPPIDTSLGTPDLDSPEPSASQPPLVGSVVAQGAYELTPTEFTPVPEPAIEGTVAKNEDGSLAFTPANPTLADKVIEEIKAEEDKRVLDFINQPIKEAPKEEEPFRPEVGDHRPDLREAGVREDRGGLGAAEPADPVPGDGGGRREPGVEGDQLGGVPEQPAGPAPLPEERPQPDPVVELGAADGPGAGADVRGGGELGREVPAPVVGGDGGRPGRRNRRSGRPDDQRPGAPPAAEGH